MNINSHYLRFWGGANIYCKSTFGFGGDISDYIYVFILWFIYVFTYDFEGRGLLFSRYGYFDDTVEFVFEDAVGFFDFG